jgi:MFS family permease
MKQLISTPGAVRLLVISLVARLPLAMLSIGLVIHTVHLTGSFAIAGVVSGANALALAASGPTLGRLVDRRGQTWVLIVSASAAGVLLCVMALVPAGTPLPALIAVSVAIGLAVPPLGACTRSLLPSLVADPETQRAVFAIEAAAVELTWVAGPPFALGLAVVCSTGLMLAVAGAVLAFGSIAFALQAPSRAWRPEQAAAGPRRVLRSPAIMTLVLAMAAIGVLVGAVEVGAAAAAAHLGSSSDAGPLLGLWGAGSLAGGIVAARLGGGARRAAGLVLILGALALGHGALALATGGIAFLGLGLMAAGAALAPAFASLYTMVDRVAPRGSATEAFAWMATASAVGGSAGSALGGAMADYAGAPAAFALAGAAGLAAALVTALRAPTLGEDLAPARAAALRAPAGASVATS